MAPTGACLLLFEDNCCWGELDGVTEVDCWDKLAVRVLEVVRGDEVGEALVVVRSSEVGDPEPLPFPLPLESSGNLRIYSARSVKL